MASLGKTIGTALKAITNVAANTQSFSSEHDVTSKFSAAIHIHFAKRSSSASTAAANLRIEGSAKDTPTNSHWYPLAILASAYAATNTIAVNGTCASGQAVVPVTSTTGLAVGGIVFIENSTLGNSEWGRIAAVSANTSITLETNLVNTQTGSTVWGGGEIMIARMDVAEYKTIRVVCDGSLFTQAYTWACDVSTLDSIS